MVPEVESDGNGKPVADSNRRDNHTLVAGEFSSWVSDMQRALRGERDADVPCGGCTACCTSSQFIHIGPDETETIALIPSDLMFPAPRRPPGHVVLGYDERGHCPMLIDNECSIYQHRPKTCRTYDCRIFPAANIEIDDDDKAQIARQVQHWQFSYPDRTDRIQHEAVRTAATFLRTHTELLPEGTATTNSAQLAVLALEIHDLFCPDDQTHQSSVVSPDLDAVRDRLMRLSPNIAAKRRSI